MAFIRQRLSQSNLDQYLKETYGDNFFYSYCEERLPVIPLLQNNYGEDNDCSLVSILTILNYKKENLDLNHFYSLIERIAKKYFYNGKNGTLPFFIATIMEQIYPLAAKARYLKNVGYNFSTIKKQIDRNNPVILSLHNDGRDFYKNHSVVIVGYHDYIINNNTVHMLLVYDNWCRSISYIDYNKLSVISSINYYINN